jgi:hypothetical protein
VGLFYKIIGLVVDGNMDIASYKQLLADHFQLFPDELGSDIYVFGMTMRRSTQQGKYFNERGKYDRITFVACSESGSRSD